MATTSDERTDGRHDTPGRGGTLTRRGFLRAAGAAGLALGGLAVAGTTPLGVQQAEAAALPTVVDTRYAADGNPDLRNPERGMYFGAYPTGTQSHTIVAKWLYLDTVCNQNLTWNGYDQAGTSPVLNAYAKTLEEARAKGVKVLFRPRYDTPDDSRPNGCGLFHADTQARQLNHIDAVAAMLGAYRDAIACIQAGYLGRWGEWNDGGFGAATVPLLTNRADRNAIIDHVLAAYAARGILQHVEVRRPVFAREVLSRNPNARVALHNDAFMTTGSDMGTYSNFEAGNPANFATSAEAKAWAQSLTANASFGGETCPATGGGERWRLSGNMIGANSEPAALHMNYLNGDWAADAVATWTSGGCYPEIKRRLGYRFEVTRVAYTPTVAAGQPFQVRIDVRNTGWAKLHKPRQAKLVLRNGTTTRVYTVAAGAVASWAPGQTTTLAVDAPAPGAGTYSVRLWLPDPDAPSRIPYAVRLATLRNGANMFDPNTGENTLGVSIAVQ
jgi:hypothetical protein